MNIFVQWIISLFLNVISFFPQVSWTKTFENATLSKKYKDKERLNNRNSFMLKILFFFQRLGSKKHLEKCKNQKKIQEQKYYYTL